MLAKFTVSGGTLSSEHPEVKGSPTAARPRPLELNEDGQVPFQSLLWLACISSVLSPVLRTDTVRDEPAHGPCMRAFGVIRPGI